MEHTAVDLDNSRRAVVLFKTAGSHCPDVPLCNIPEEDAALASGKSPVNEKSPSLVPGMILQDQVAPVEVVPEEISPLPMGDISKEEEEVFEENSSYEPDPDMPPLVTSEPPKQFKILRRKPSPSPEVQRALITQGGSCPPSSESSGSASKSNAEKTLEEREKDYALARARIFNYENLDGSAAAELAGLTLDDAPQRFFFSFLFCSVLFFPFLFFSFLFFSFLFFFFFSFPLFSFISFPFSYPSQPPQTHLRFGDRWLKRNLSPPSGPIPRAKFTCK